LLRNTVFVCLSTQNHDLLLVAEAFTCQSKVNRLGDIQLRDEETLFLDAVCDKIISEEAVALTAVEGDNDDVTIEEEEQEEQEDNRVVLEPELLEFDVDRHRRCIWALQLEGEQIIQTDAFRGIWTIGCALIEEQAHRSGWQRRKAANAYVDGRHRSPLMSSILACTTHWSCHHRFSGR
jgi:hypothetical protein